MILPTCKEVSTIVAQGEFDLAPWPRRLRFYLHLAICVYCRRFKRQMGLVVQALGRAVFPTPRPERIAVLEKAALAKLGLGG